MQVITAWHYPFMNRGIAVGFDVVFSYLSSFKLVFVGESWLFFCMLGLSTQDFF